MSNSEGSTIKDPQAIPAVTNRAKKPLEMQNVKKLIMVNTFVFFLPATIFRDQHITRKGSGLTSIGQLFFAKVIC